MGRRFMHRYHSHDDNKRDETLEKAGMYGAVLLTGSLESSDADLHEDFDLWQMVTKFEQINETPDDQLVTGDSIENVEQRIREKYPTEVGGTRIQRYTGYVKTTPEKKQESWRSRISYDERWANGWMVMKYPVAVNPLGRDELRTLCATEGAILISHDDYRHSGNDEQFREEGFTITTSGDFYKLRWNPKNAALQDHRLKVAKAKELLSGDLPGDVLCKIGDAVNIKGWSDCKFDNIISGVNRSFYQENRSGWHRRHREVTTNYKPFEILLFVELAGKILPKDKRKPWREEGRYTANQLKGAIEEALPYVHGLLDSKNVVTKQFGKWIVGEARFFKLKLPVKPKLPEKPRFKGGLPCKAKPKGLPRQPAAPVVISSSSNANGAEDIIASNAMPTTDLTPGGLPGAGSASSQQPSCSNSELELVGAS